METAPDTTSALVVSGRNTYNTAGNFYYTDNSDTYVTAAVASDKSLAVIYLSHPVTITINQSLMNPGYGAYWVDPRPARKRRRLPGPRITAPPREPTPRVTPTGCWSSPRHRTRHGRSRR